MKRSDERSAPGPQLLDPDRPPAGARRLALAEPGYQVRQRPIGEAGDLLLAIGADQASATALIDAPGAGLLAGLVLRQFDEPTTAAITRRAQQRDVALYWLSPEQSWNQVHRALAEALAEDSPEPASAGLPAGDDDLAELAQTIATLTGGLVTIEDTAARVLAYSRSSDDVDDLRRLSILGRSGPPEYLALLRDWGIYDRLAASEEVVEIAEHPESGVRRRLAVGIFAGRRQLGTIWVQQGQHDFGPHAQQALLGAARLTAAHLVDRRGQPNRARVEHGQLSELLAGRSRRITGLEGRVAERPCAVVAFDLGAEQPDRAAERLMLDSLTGVITVHAAALRRDSVTEIIADRVYLLLPGVESEPAIDRVVRAMVDAARRHVQPSIRAAIGPIVAELSAASTSRAAADLALDHILRTGSRAAVTRFLALRPELVVEAASAAVAQRPELRDAALDDLVKADPEVAETLMKYLDSGSAAQLTADLLDVHVTTVRYRLRKAESVLGIDLTDPAQRLAAQLQLHSHLANARDTGMMISTQ